MVLGPVPGLGCVIIGSACSVWAYESRAVRQCLTEHKPLFCHVVAGCASGLKGMANATGCSALSG